MGGYQSSDFIAYLDDDDEKKEIYAEVLEVNVSFVKFKTTNGNVIIIPIDRILKIKNRSGGL